MQYEHGMERREPVSSFEYTQLFLNLNSGLRERRARILVAIGNYTGHHVTTDLSDPPLMGLNKSLTSYLVTQRDSSEEEWWAHNPQAEGSRPSLASFFFFLLWPAKVIAFAVTGLARHLLLFCRRLVRSGMGAGH